MSKQPETSYRTFTLKTPIVIAGVETSTLKMREPLTRDFRRAFNKSAVEKLSQQQIMLVLAADLCGLAEEEFDELRLDDMTKIVEAVESFA